MQSSLMKILVKKLVGEYRETHEIIANLDSLVERDKEKLNEILNKLDLYVGEKNFAIKGFIIVPELFSHEHFTNSEIHFKNINQIKKIGLEKYFSEVIPKDKAIVIGEDGIAYGVHLEELVTYAQKITDLNIEEITRRYIYQFKRFEDIGERTITSIAAAVILNNQEVLKNKYGIDTPEIFTSDFYKGGIYCKTRTIVNNTYTAPITVFGFNCPIGTSSDFLLQTEEEVDESLNPKEEDFFDSRRRVVGVLREYEYDKEREKVVIKEQRLVKPVEFEVEQIS